MFEESTIKIEEELRKNVPPPVAVISSPSPLGIYTVFQTLNFDGSESYDRYYKIAGYYWDFDSDLIIDSREPVDKYYYPEPGEYNLTLKVINDPGAIGSASQIVKVYTRNQKNREKLKYSLFLIRDNDRSNNEDILRLIPVTTWNDADGSHSVPYYVYYVNYTNKTLTEWQLKNIMDRYGKKGVYIFDDKVMSDNYCGGESHCEFKIGSYTLDIYKPGQLDDVYFDFWDLYEYVVVVDPDEIGAKLIASLFAAFYNSPIMFIDSTNLDEYKDKIKNNYTTKRVYSIPSFDSLDKSVRSFITDSNLDYKSYSPQELRTGNVNRIIKWTSNVSMTWVIK